MWEATYKLRLMHDCNKMSLIFSTLPQVPSNEFITAMQVVPGVEGPLRPGKKLNNTHLAHNPGSHPQKTKAEASQVINVQYFVL